MQNIRIRFSCEWRNRAPLFGEGIPILTAFLELTRITVPRGAPREKEGECRPSATFPSEQSDEIEFSLNRNGFLRMSKREASDTDACPNLHEKRTVDS